MEKFLRFAAVVAVVALVAYREHRRREETIVQPPGWTPTPVFQDWSTFRTPSLTMPEEWRLREPLSSYLSRYLTVPQGRQDGRGPLG